VCSSVENSPIPHHQHHHHGQHDQSRTYSQRHEDTSELLRRSSCDEDVPLNLSLSSAHRPADSGPQHHKNAEPHQPGCSLPCTSSVCPAGVDGTAWRHRSRPHDEMDSFTVQQQPPLRRPESSPCLRPDIRKSSSAGTAVTVVVVVIVVVVVRCFSTKVTPAFRSI